MTKSTAPPSAAEIAETRDRARTGDADAKYQLAGLYYSGRGVAQDQAEGVRWSRLAADQRHAGAQYMLGHLYANRTQDHAHAVHWYRLAADQGHADAQFDLGAAYAMGKGVAQDATEAVRWFRLAADQGLATAQCTLGLLYAQGKGVAQDQAEAVRWTRLAADQGHPDAQTQLESIYARYRSDADKGDAAAQQWIGSAYATGLGGAQDYTEAVRWFGLAADQRNPVGQWKLGEAYSLGRRTTVT